MILVDHPRDICPDWFSDDVGATSSILVPVLPGAFRECQCGIARRQCRSGCFTGLGAPVPLAFGSLPDSLVIPWLR